MKAGILSTTILGFAALVNLAAGDLSTNLQKGLFEEEANHNLNAAIQAYQSAVADFDKDRQLAATAVFRLAECFRKQGNTNAATALYERVLREFSDQSQLTTPSRQQLAALGWTPPSTTSPALSDSARQEQKRLFDEEIRLQEEKLAVLQKQLQNGAVPPSELLPTKMEILELKRKKAALDAAPTENPAVALGTSVDADEVRRIQDLIANSPDLINAPDKEGLTLLQRAAGKGQLDVVKLLLESGAAVNGLQQPGLTPLHYAGGNGHKAVVDLLLSKGAKVDAATESGVTPLHLAARNGYAVIVKTLLDAGAAVDPVVTKNVDWNTENLRYHFASGQTPLHAAAESGQQEVVALLVAKGANVNAVDGQGRTALSYAVQGRFAGVVKTLLDAKADPNAGGRDLPLSTAAAFGDLELVKLLLAKGADPNKQAIAAASFNRATVPLSLAVSAHHPEVVTELIKFKADPNALDWQDTPVLFSAISEGGTQSDQATLKALLDGGADPNLRAPTGNGPLHQAVTKVNLPAVQLLLEHRADPNLRNGSGETPLHFAVQGGRKDIIDLLLVKGADVNPADSGGRTPLAVALANSSGTTYPGGPGMPLPLPQRNILNGAIVPPPSASRATAREIADLLRSHGAVTDLPDFSSIRLTRPGWPVPATVFQRDKAELNRFTLLELIANFCSPDRGPRPGFPGARSPILPFPDFSHVRIHRPEGGKTGKSREISVNLLSGTGSFDCGQDVPLEFGDIVEIPEREHPLSEDAKPLTNGQWLELEKCLQRRVTFIVKGQPSQVTLSGTSMNAYLSKALGWQEVQAVLRSSSDLSHLLLKRPATGNEKGQKLEFSVLPFWNNQTPLSDDLWLRDGDVIDVPDKT
jgi:ankyrin repeat protein